MKNNKDNLGCYSKRGADKNKILKEDLINNCKPTHFDDLTRNEELEVHQVFSANVLLEYDNNSLKETTQDMDGRKKNVLLFKCESCSNKCQDFFQCDNCLNCLLINLYNNQNLFISKFKMYQIKEVILRPYHIILNSGQTKLIIEYFKNIEIIKKFFNKILILRKEKCNFKKKGMVCKHFENYNPLFIISQKDYFDPIKVYEMLMTQISYIKQNIINSEDKINKLRQNKYCFLCVKEIINHLKSIKDIFENLEIIKSYKSFKEINFESNDNFVFYEHFLGHTVRQRPEIIMVDNAFEKGGKDKIISEYQIGDYDLYKVRIFDVKHESEKKYEVILNIKEEDEVYFENIYKKIFKDLKIINSEEIISLEELIRTQERNSYIMIKKNFNITDREAQKFSFYMAIKYLRLEKIFPLLIDDNIEEIFFDRKNDTVYINHRDYYRCRTSIRFSDDDIERIKTLIRLYSGKRLDISNPSIKYVIKNEFFFCRFSLDTNPIHFEGFGLDIRKLDRNILTIQDLLKKHTLNPLMAAFLYFCILLKINITVTGKTDTGKTTLINALDLLTPKDFRKIYVENVTESLNQLKFGKHQLKYNVDSLIETEENGRFSKENQIKKLLHRSPDIIYLGEILTKEEAEAMFHCLAAGLKGFQTIHSNSVKSLINRFLYHFKIDISCLNDLDLIVLMNKDYNERKIVSISEIIIEENNLGDLEKNIFTFDSMNNNWKKIAEHLYEIKVIKNALKYKNINKEDFSIILKIYEDIFNYLLNINRVPNQTIVSFFHKLSHFSRRSISELNIFWNDYKMKLENSNNSKEISSLLITKV